MKDLLARIEADIANVKTWSDVTDDSFKRNGAVAYGGRGQRWIFLVVAFGTDGRAGTVTRLPLSGPGVPWSSADPHIVNLPPELAAKAYDAAKAAREKKT